MSVMDNPDDTGLLRHAAPQKTSLIHHYIFWMLENAFMRIFGHPMLVNLFEETGSG